MRCDSLVACNSDLALGAIVVAGSSRLRRSRDIGVVAVQFLAVGLHVGEGINLEATCAALVSG